MKGGCDVDRRVGRTEGDDDVTPSLELLERLDVLEAGRRRPLGRRAAAPGRRPEDRVPGCPQLGADRRAHLARVHDPDVHGGPGPAWSSSS